MVFGLTFCFFSEDSFLEMLECLCLAQADAHVTNDLISVQGVQVEPLVEMLSSDDYQRKLASDTVLKSLTVFCVNRILMPVLTVLKSNWTLLVVMVCITLGRT